jgi:gamma-glutamyl-gamma-aminobutyrate hydrolase PuuD
VSRAAAPRIAITVTDPSTQVDPDTSRRKNELYAAAIARHGGVPVLVHAGQPVRDRADALGAMDALLLSGGPDLDPARYGQPDRGSETVDAARDELEATAWAAAAERALPVVGLCRGLQAINVFSGGTLLQHVDDHGGPPLGTGPARTHPLRVEPGTRLARILFPTNVRGGVLEVNTYHHQAVGAADLAPGLVPSARAASPAGDLIEGLETRDGRFVLGLQCHPERTESTPAPFERLFAFFVNAARGPLSGGRAR